MLRGRKGAGPTKSRVVAVAARRKESAEKFAQKFGIPAVYGSYEELAKDSSVEIVYVGTIHPQHYAACMMFLEHGKHVLCEKPMTMSVKQCKEVIAKAREKKLFFMEAFWTRFFPCVSAIQEELGSGSLGKINFLRCCFCVPVGGVDRLTKKELGGGGLLDVGCYLVQYANLVFRKKPEKIIAVGDLNTDGVDIGGTLLLHYKDGGMAILYYHTDSAMGSNSLTIHGSKGNLEVPAPMHSPTQLTLPSGVVKTFPLPDTQQTFNFINSIGLVYEAQCVRDCLKQGLMECPKMTYEDSISIMEVMEEALCQMGVQYNH
nr:hypothetical protein BaRGS_034691 [Batillaria attramentaria]